MKLFSRDQWSTVIAAGIVFVLAILIRLPSCYQSFWVDELHTAWAVWADLSEVSKRATLGNQTPLYFQVMWIWKSIVGDSEVALRMSSVLAVATASALLVLGVRQTTQDLSAGVLSGLVLAVESNSVFFGTEFRPYAFVMLFTVIATWAAVAMLTHARTIGRANLRLILVSAVCCAALLHPTAVVTLGILVGLTLLVSFLQHRSLWQFQISDVVACILIAAVAFSLLHSSLGDSWENRNQWRAFGQASSLRQLWLIWDWIPLAILPGFLAVTALRTRRVVEVVQAFVPAAAAVTATCLFFAASYFDWVPLWHRRYFVAALPMLAWSTGGCALLVLPNESGKWRTSAAMGLVVCLIGLLTWQQDTITQWRNGKTQLVFRGEDWRGAAAWIASSRAPSDAVLLDSGLVEGQQPFAWGNRERLGSGYFLFPLSGPYRLEKLKEGFVRQDWSRGFKVDHFGFSIRATESYRRPGRGNVDFTDSGREHIWFVARSSRQAFARQVTNWEISQQLHYELKSFGRVHVVRFDVLRPRLLDGWEPIDLGTYNR
ncbi:MAG: hypothetical protein HKN47_17515 [Pirellulaceae bacterium]|nr:hypothetical protein [Pirellulaceae bacterium]